MEMPKFSEGGGSYKAPEPGLHPAILYSVVRIGHHLNPYNGKTADKVVLTWELHGEDDLTDDGKPLAISKYYTYSGHENASLRLDLEAWRGAKYTPETWSELSWAKIAGLPCMLQVITEKTADGKDRAKVASIAKMMKGMPAPQQVNQTVIFDIGKWDQALFDSLPNFLKSAIEKSDEFKARGALPVAGQPVSAGSAPNYAVELDDEIPF